MLNKIKHIEVKNVVIDTESGLEKEVVTSYPLAFTLNVMERIQDEFGSFDGWADTIQPTEKVINKETEEVEIDEKGNEITKALEPKVKYIIWTFKEFINEGIKIENRNKTIKLPLLTHEEIGWLISDAGLQNVIKAIKEVTAGSVGEKSPNVETAQV